MKNFLVEKFERCYLRQMSFVNQNAKRTRLVTLLIVAAAAVLSANSAVATPLGKQLVELESHITWAAVDNAWKNLRPR